MNTLPTDPVLWTNGISVSGQEQVGSLGGLDEAVENNVHNTL